MRKCIAILAILMLPALVLAYPRTVMYEHFTQDG